MNSTVLTGAALIVSAARILGGLGTELHESRARDQTGLGSRGIPKARSLIILRWI